MINLFKKASKIKCLIVDVDGVLTNGQIHYTNNGDEIKSFHVHDGLGMKMLLNANIEIAVITSRQSEILTRRMNELGVKHVYQGAKEKISAYENLKAKLNLEDEEMAMVGDDLPDVPLFKKVGLSITVANAASGITNHTDWQTLKSGGHGAVREICEFILTAQNAWPLSQS